MLIERFRIASIAHRPDHRVGRLVIDVDEGNLCTLCCKMHHLRGADATGTTRHKNRPAAQTRIVGKASAHGKRSKTARTISSGVPPISTVMGCSSGPGSSSV